MKRQGCGVHTSYFAIVGPKKELFIIRHLRFVIWSFRRESNVRILVSLLNDAEQMTNVQ